MKNFHILVHIGTQKGTHCEVNGIPISIIPYKIHKLTNIKSQCQTDNLTNSKARQL